MRKIYNIAIFLLAFFWVSCDDANDLLNQHIKEGSIVYAGKIDELDIQSGFYRVRVNIYPAEDVNRSHGILRWNITAGEKDSVRVDYVEANYDADMGCYYALIPLPDIEGNLLLESYNVDKFGNRSLLHSEGAFVYGSTYFSDAGDALFESRMGVVGHVISYEKNNGQFTEDIVVHEDYYPLVDAKVGGVIRSKTRYLITETDLDTLEVTDYLETVIEDDDVDDVLADLLKNTNWTTAQVASGVLWKRYHFADLYGSKQYVTLFDVDLNNENIQIKIPHVTSGFLKTSTAGEEQGADIAFNGSYFSTSSGGSTVYFRYDNTLVAQTGTSFPAFRENGAFTLTSTGKAEIVQKPARGWSSLSAENILAGGPLLMAGGQKVPQVNDVFNTDRHPRTIMGITGSNRLIVAVVDGRSSESAGLTIPEALELMLALGCRSAVNMDGGGSSTAWVNGNGVVNHPTDNGLFDHQGERGVATVFTIKSN
jgi:hypothetical protein